MTALRESFLELTGALGVSGHEQQKLRLVAAWLRQACDEVTVDQYGTVTGIQHGPPGALRIVVDTHVDQLGLMVTRVLPDGRLRFAKLGGFDDRTLLHKKVALHGAHGPVPGIIASDRPLQRYVAADLDSLYIDIGADRAEEVAAAGIGERTPVVMGWHDERLVEFQHGVISGPGLDNTMPTLVVVEAMKRVRQEHHGAEVHAVLHCQAEVNMRGGGLAGRKSRPDAFIMLEAEGVNVPPFDRPHDVTTRFKQGPVLRLMMGLMDPLQRGFLADPRVRRLLEREARARGIPYQVAVSGADKPGAFVSRGGLMISENQGIPTCFIRVPMKYKHSPIELSTWQDLEHCIQLTAAGILALARDLEKVDGEYPRTQIREGGG